jgi:hypothetical protein
METKGIKSSTTWRDFHVESYEKSHGIVQNLNVENNYGQRYKLVIKSQFWAPLWPLDCVWACMHFVVVGIYACFNRVA